MKIGVCMREYNKNGKYSCFNKRMGVPKSLIDICQNFNVTPILLTMGCGLRDIIDTTDGLIIPGSSLSMNDIREYPVDKEIIQMYLHKKPIFGICGGMQELCIALGGNVIENGAKHHMGTEHDISLNGYFCNVFGCSTISVNSYHNDCCILNCTDTAISVHNNDLILEGFFENNNLGVQWHPEVMKREHYEPLFKFFFDLCTKK